MFGKYIRPVGQGTFDQRFDIEGPGWDAQLSGNAQRDLARRSGLAQVQPQRQIGGCLLRFCSQKFGAKALAFDARLDEGDLPDVATLQPLLIDRDEPFLASQRLLLTRQHEPAGQRIDVGLGRLGALLAQRIGKLGLGDRDVVLGDGYAARTFAAGEADALADAACALFSEDLHVLGVRGRTYAEAEHGWDTVFDRLFAVYRDVVAAGRGGEARRL